MSAQSIAGAAAAVPAGELATLQRMQQLQALIESARQVSNGGVITSAGTASAGAPSAGAGDFASALQAATSSDAASANAAGTEAAGTAGAGLGGESEYESLIDQAATRNGLDPAILHGLIEQESGFDPSATSSAGAAGLTQLMPGTASSLGVANPLDPAESIEGGARYLGQLMGQFGGNAEDALAAYNAGPGAVQQYGGVPPYSETQSYVSKVLANAEAFRQSHPTSTVGSLV
ncbi:MAG TPA: lytic transglycosylase domain-containing protein [Solirubrobacteraceae bacterium]|jgi:soluble lytic murein transglycosylase-like protein|nr:lytic transglycosylase domain-containing protein [Solirubrobacteraceae bacterium]